MAKKYSSPPAMSIDPSKKYTAKIETTALPKLDEGSPAESRNHAPPAFVLLKSPFTGVEFRLPWVAKRMVVSAGLIATDLTDAVS